MSRTFSIENLPDRYEEGEKEAPMLSEPGVFNVDALPDRRDPIGVTPSLKDDSTFLGTKISFKKPEEAPAFTINNEFELSAASDTPGVKLYPSEKEMESYTPETRDALLNVQEMVELEAFKRDTPYIDWSGGLPRGGRWDAFLQGMIPTDDYTSKMAAKLYPGARFGGKLAQLVALSYITGGVYPKAQAFLTRKMVLDGTRGITAKTIPMITNAIHRAAAFSIGGILDVAARETTTAEKILTPLEAGAFGALLGGTHGIPTTKLRVAAKGLAPAAWLTVKKLITEGEVTKRDLVEIGIQASLYALLESINAKAVTSRYESYRVGAIMRQRAFYKTGKYEPAPGYTFDKAGKVTIQKTMDDIEKEAYISKVKLRAMERAVSQNKSLSQIDAIVKKAAKKAGEVEYNPAETRLSIVEAAFSNPAYVVPTEKVPVSFKGIPEHYQIEWVDDVGSGVQKGLSISDAVRMASENLASIFPDIEFTDDISREALEVQKGVPEDSTPTDIDKLAEQAEQGGRVKINIEDVSFQDSYVWEQMQDEGFEMPVGQDFIELNDNQIRADKNILSQAFINKMQSYGVEQVPETTESGDFVLYRGGDSEELMEFSYLTATPEEAARYGEVHKHLVHPADIAYSSEENNFIFNPRSQSYDKAQGAVPTVKDEPSVTVSQKKVAHAWARKKGLVDSKGEVTDRYRLLAEKSTGKRSMADMTEKEAETFIDNIKRMPDIRRTLNDYPSEKRFKTRPGLTTPFTPQNITAEILGLKPFVEPMERARMTIMKEESVLRREIHDVLKALDKKSKVSRENMALALNKYENSSDLPVDKFDEESKAVFDYFRTLTRSMLERMNAIREEYGLEPIEGIEAYFRHIVDPLAQEIIYGNDKLPEALKKWASENLSDKVYNPMERKRKIEDKLLEYFSKDIEYVMNAMVRTALKEIHMTGPKQLLNDLKSVYKKPSKKDLEKMSPEERAIADQIEEMPAETEKWLNDYVKIVLLREEQTTLDQWANAWLKTSDIGRFVKDQFLEHGIVLSDQAFTNLITNISKLPLYGTLALRPKPIIRNKFQRVQDIALYGLQAVWRGALPTSNYPLLEELKTDSLFRDVYSGIEGMPGDLKRQIGGILLKGFQWSAFSNVDQTMNAAFHWTMDKIQDPAKRDLGWADPQRDYTEDKNFLYPSERELVLKEMEFGAQTTQYLYMGMGMPQLFRYKAASGVTRLQSWWMNHWFNFLREATHRALTGEVGWEATTISKGTGPLGRDEIRSRRPKVDAKSRTNLLWYLLIGGTVLNTLGYGRSFLFGTMPLQPPPVAAFVINLVTYLASDDENTRRKAKRGMKNAALTIIPGYLGYKDAKAFLSGDAPLSSYLFYNKIKERLSFRPK